MKRTIFQFLLMALLITPLIRTYAHQPNNSLVYLRIYEEEGIEGRFDINVNELNSILGLNLPKKASIDDVRPFMAQINKYLLDNASFSSTYGNHQIVFTDELGVINTSFGSFILIYFYLENVEKVPDDLNVTFKAFIEEHPSHTNLLGIEYNWKAGMINNEALISLEFSKDNYTKTLSLTDTSLWKGFIAMVKQGVWHIWIGLDHILFLLALVLPSVVRRITTPLARGEATVKKSSFIAWNWVPVERFKPAFLYILKVVTFFTIAHTITLSLAALQIINLPSNVVESIIAFSIGLAAYHNIRPIFIGKDWVIAFVFGLFHGFGFASVLGELGFKGEFLSLSLLGFNVGVEIGQILIIALIFPVLYFMRNLKIYPKFLVFLSSLLIIISLYWLYERAFDVNLPLDEDIRGLGGKILRWLGILEPLK